MNRSRCSVIAAAIVWAAVILASAAELRDTQHWTPMLLILGGGAAATILLVGGALLGEGRR